MEDDPYSTSQNPVVADQPLKLKLVIRHPVPSLNDLFSQSFYERQKEKSRTQAALLLALSPSGDGYSMRTTLHRSFLSTAYATLASFRETVQRDARLERLRSGLG